MLGTLAVGGRVTPLPPAQIPACATNAPGSCRRSDVIGLRGLGGPYSSDPWARGYCDMPFPALSPGHAKPRALPSTDRLPSTVSAADVTRLCSRFPRYYAVVRLLMPSSRASLFRASPTGPGPRRGCGQHEASQVPHKGLLHTHGVSDCARSIPTTASSRTSTNRSCISWPSTSGRPIWARRSSGSANSKSLRAREALGEPRRGPGGIRPIPAHHLGEQMPLSLHVAQIPCGVPAFDLCRDPRGETPRARPEIGCCAWSSNRHTGSREFI